KSTHFHKNESTAPTGQSIHAGSVFPKAVWIWDACKSVIVPVPPAHQYIFVPSCPAALNCPMSKRVVAARFGIVVFATLVKAAPFREIDTWVALQRAITVTSPGDPLPVDTSIPEPALRRLRRHPPPCTVSPK